MFPATIIKQQRCSKMCLFNKIMHTDCLLFYSKLTLGLWHSKIPRALLFKQYVWWKNTPYASLPSNLTTCVYVKNQGFTSYLISSIQTQLGNHWFAKHSKNDSHNNPKRSLALGLWSPLRVVPILDHIKCLGFRVNLLMKLRVKMHSTLQP